MDRLQVRILSLPIVVLVVLLLGGLACSKSEPTESPKPSTEWTDYTTQTESYQVVLRTGPTVTLEVMMEGATMTTVDGGQMVNHHLEVHIFDKSSGSEIKVVVPTVNITALATGDPKEFAVDLHPSREIPYVKACLLANHRVTEPHFGDNLYLGDGTYTVTVRLGDETAVFENVVMKAAGASGT